MENNNPPRKRSRRWPCIILVIAIILALIILAYLLFLIAKKGVILSSLNNNQASNQTSNINVVTTDDPYKGSNEAKVVIVEFSDFECPYCFQEFPVVRQIIETYGDQINFIFRDFPIADHPYAQKAAEAGECAHEQGKFWQMHDKMFINHDQLDDESLKIYAQQVGLDTNQFNECLDSGKYKKEVENDYANGLAAGVTGTPTFFINGQIVEGAVPLEFFKQVIDLGLKMKWAK